MKLRLILLISLFPIICQGQIVKGLKQMTDRVDITLSDGTLTIYPLTNNAVRIRFYKDIDVKMPEFIFTSIIQTPAFEISDLPSKIEIVLKNILVELDKQTGKLSFADNTGKVFLSEKENSRKLTPDSVMGEPCFVAEQSFGSPADEYIFGLGQFQDGHYNIRSVSRRLTQVNSQISLPLIYSSKGYGLLWHQYGLTDFNPADHLITIEKQEQSDFGNNQMAQVTTTSGTQKILQDQSRFFLSF
jgi:alpha-D-xyloside xylohydrolase